MRQQLQRRHEDSLGLDSYGRGRRKGGQPRVEEQVPVGEDVAKDEMAALAAELEAELQLMEHTINAEELFQDQVPIHDAGEVSSQGQPNSYYSDTSSHGVLETATIERPADLGALQVDYAVSPIELDRRLREVLEAQQHERILELEARLKETEAKLLAKDHEILHWKSHVTSLTSLLQPAAAPEVAMGTMDELLHSFQDPPISTHLSYVESASESSVCEDCSQLTRRWGSVAIPSSHRSSHEKASHSSSSSIGGASNMVDMAMETDGCWDWYRTGIETPDFVVIEEFDLHYATTETLRGQAVSKALEARNSSLPEMLNPLELVMVSPLQEEYLKGECLVGGAPPSTRSLNSLIGDANQPSVQATTRSMESKNGSLQVQSKGLRRSSTLTKSPTDMQSPVLDKIRHFEALTSGKFCGKSNIEG